MAQLSLLTAAFLAGKTVTLTGSGTCVNAAGVNALIELVNYVIVSQ